MSNAKRVTGLLTLALLTVVGIWGFIAWRNAPPIEHVSTPDPLDKLGFSATTGAAPGYLPDEACASCHAELYASYQDVGMARSFTRPRPENLIEDFENNQFYHAPSQLSLIHI